MKYTIARWLFDRRSGRRCWRVWKQIGGRDPAFFEYRQIVSRLRPGGAVAMYGPDGRFLAMDRRWSKPGGLDAGTAPAVADVLCA